MCRLAQPAPEAIVVIVMTPFASGGVFRHDTVWDRRREKRRSYQVEKPWPRTTAWQTGSGSTRIFAHLWSASTATAWGYIEHGAGAGEEGGGGGLRPRGIHCECRRPQDRPILHGGAAFLVARRISVAPGLGGHAGDGLPPSPQGQSTGIFHRGPGPSQGPEHIPEDSVGGDGPAWKAHIHRHKDGRERTPKKARRFPLVKITPLKMPAAPADPVMPSPKCNVWSPSMVTARARHYLTRRGALASPSKPASQLVPKVEPDPEPTREPEADPQPTPEVEVDMVPDTDPEPEVAEDSEDPGHQV
ncbi:uncharacterized protein LOC125297958 [Alosa alosa]|uniref:uncharacterized protein LOC125297958 n=1 Tax=Alosa alosa TaxID=278164 RepID=UPI002015374C|nr:uncharacterized protein LOC125297958 [Alosa alosa]